MSERGIEIHNGKIVIPGSQMRQIQLGTWASPLTQTLAAQVLVSAVVNAIALGGAIKAGEFGIKGSVTATANLVAVSARTTVNAGVVVTGYVYGLHIQTEVLATGQIAYLAGVAGSGIMEAIRIEQYVPTGGITYIVQSIFISNYMQVTPTNGYYFFRCAENGGAIVTAFMRFSLGGASTASFFMELAGTETVWASGGFPSVQNGWIKIQVNSQTRYIRLYSTAP